MSTEKLMIMQLHYKFELYFDCKIK